MEDYKLVRANIMTSGYLFRPVPNSADYMEVSQAVFIIVIIIFNVVLGLYIYCHRKHCLLNIFMTFLFNIYFNIHSANLGKHYFKLGPDNSVFDN